jgi:hypothetical protein
MEILEIAISTGTLGHQMVFGGDKDKCCPLNPTFR